MRQHHRDGSGRRFARPDDPADRRHGGHHHDHHHHRHDHPRGHGRHGGGHGGGRRGGRPFDYGALRLLVLALIAEGPRHGYELMKAIEERMAGSYSPSPGVIYPTLAWLEEMGYAALEPGEGARKRYAITTEGQAFLAANRGSVGALLARLGPAGGGGPPEGVPDPILRAMENLKLALRLRLRRGPVEPAAAEAIAAAIDAAARAADAN